MRLNEKAEDRRSLVPARQPRFKASDASKTHHRPPLVSVIMPTYNRADFLPGAIESVLSQSYPSLELLLIDDGSTDHTREVCALYPGIRYIRQAHGGVSRARNLGLKAACGQYVAYCDDDDVWYSHHLQVLLQCLENRPNIGLIYSDLNWIHKRNSGPLYSADFNKTRLEECNYILSSSVLHRRECTDTVGGFDERLSCFEDWDLWLRISDRYLCWHVPNVTGDFVWHGDNMSGYDHWQSQHAVSKKRSDARADSSWQRALLLPGYASLKISALDEIARWLGIDIVEAIPLIRESEELLFEEWRARPRKTESDIVNFYDRSRAYIPYLMNCNLKNELELVTHYEQLLTFAKNEHYKSIVDYGSGVGSSGIVFASNGFDVTLTDVSSALIDFCLWRFASRDLPVRTIDLKDASLPAQAFDCATVISVLEYVTDPLKHVNSIARSVKSGGMVVFKTDLREHNRLPMVFDHAPLTDEQLSAMELVPVEHWQESEWRIYRKL